MDQLDVNFITYVQIFIQEWLGKFCKIIIIITIYIIYNIITLKP